MLLRFHVCKNDADADALITFLKADQDFEGQNIRKMIDPDIKVLDHSEKLRDPINISRHKVCVVYEE